METREEIEATLNQNFKEIMIEPSHDRSREINQITRNIPSPITQQHNELLMKPISLTEVEEAAFQMEEGKAPSPDGFTVNFFHHFWDIIKQEVWKIIEDSRVSRKILPAFNATFLTLNPKCEGVDSLDKLRPISLCNVIYEIITKIIANRLKPLLPSLISLEQSRFVEGRQITDGIILLHEVLHSVRTKKISGMMVKLDIAKAHDKINWQIMRKLLTTFRFRDD